MLAGKQRAWGVVAIEIEILIIAALVSLGFIGGQSDHYRVSDLTAAIPPLSYAPLPVPPEAQLPPPNH
jgi:hypothetical protein